MAESRNRPGNAWHTQTWRYIVLSLPGVVLLAALLAAYHYLSQPGRLPLRVVEVTGEFTYLDHAAIEKQVASAINGGFFDVDLQRIRREVSGMPWVEQVSVRRVWPDTLQMHVSEQVPIAYWNEDALLNLAGEIFRPQSMPELDSLPQLSGQDARAPQVVAFYLQLQARLMDESLRVDRIRLNPRGEWLVEFRNGLSLMLGREDIARRQQAFLDLYPQLLAKMPRRPERIDMRYEHGFAVRWQENASGES